MFLYIFYFLYLRFLVFWCDVFPDLERPVHSSHQVATQFNSAVYVIGWLCYVVAGGGTLWFGAKMIMDIVGDGERDETAIAHIRKMFSFFLIALLVLIIMRVIIKVLWDSQYKKVL